MQTKRFSYAVFLVFLYGMRVYMPSGEVLQFSVETENVGNVE